MKNDDLKTPKMVQNSAQVLVVITIQKAINPFPRSTAAETISTLDPYNSRTRPNEKLLRNISLRETLRRIF